MRRRTGIRAIAAAVALTLLATACGDDGGSSKSASGSLTKVKLQLQWVTQAQFAGYFAGTVSIAASRIETSSPCSL